MLLASLDTLILDQSTQLASAGIGGVCIAMVIWTARLISRLPNNAGIEKHRTIRQFMVMCVSLAAVACVSFAANAHYSREKIAAAETDKKQAEAAVTVAHTQLNRVSQLLSQGQYPQATQAVDQVRRDLVLKPLNQLIPPDQLFKKAPAP